MGDVATRYMEGREVRRKVCERARDYLRRNDGGRQDMMTRGRKEGANGNEYMVGC